MDREHVDWREQDDEEEHDLDERHAMSRRALLGAAGGFALATSGLFVPDWLSEEADAADQLPVRRVQQRKERKRRKRGHDSRKRRRAAGKKRGNLKLFRDVAIYVYNGRYYDSVQVQGWVGRSAYNNQMDPYYMPNKDWDWATLSNAGQSSGPTSRAFIGDDDTVVVRIGAGFVVSGWNHWVGWPEAEILTGGWDAHGWNPVGQSLALGGKMEVNSSISSSGIKVTRHDDTERHIIFKVDLT